MKKILISFLFGILSLASFCQIAHWKVAPTFDDVKILPNGLILASIGQKCGLYDGSGNELLPIEYTGITDYAEDVAIAFKDGKFAGIVDMNGNIVDLSNSGYTPLVHQLAFSNDILNVVKLDKENNRSWFYFINKKGTEVAGPFIICFPFFDGYALVQKYANEKKLEDPYWTFLDSNLQEVYIPAFEKKQSIQSISSFRDGQAVCIYKNKGYFISDQLNVTPINVDSLATKKSQLAIDNKTFNIVTNENDIVVYAKNATLTFNRNMQLDRIESDGNIIYSYEPHPADSIVVKSDLDKIEKSGEYGLAYKDNIILPAQFSDIKLLNGRFALAKLDGKWGFITVDPENQFQFKLNNNEHIGFNHRFYIAKLATLMPSYIKCSNTTVYSQSPDCEIQVESRNEIENIERNTLTYDCKLSIPSSLADTLAMQEYTYAVKYDGLQSIDYKLSIPEWYVKYYEVELSNTKFTVNPNDTIAVEFDLVKTDAARNDDTNYFKTVELITPGNENIPLNKITENHYAFRIGSGDRDRLSFIVKITESGCPSIEYPFEMVFTKPAPRSKDKSVNVTVNAIRRDSQQKNGSVSQPVSEPIFVPK